MLPATSPRVGRVLPQVLQVAVFLCGVSAGQVHAQAVESHAEPGLVVGAKLGANTGSVFNTFGLSYVAELELGYLLPLPDPARHAFQVFAAGAYTAPHLQDQLTTTDARLPGAGRAHYAIDQRILAITAGVLGRIPLQSRVWAPYLALGYRGYAVSSKARGDVAGQAFGTNTEQGYEHGFYAAAGIDAFVGPGALLAEIQFAYAARDAFLLRNTNVGALQLLMGYRLMFGSRAGPAHSHHDDDGIPTHEATPDQAAPGANARAAEQQAAETEPPPQAATTGEAPADSESIKSTTGQIRGNVRSFRGSPLKATVLVQPEGLRATTNEDGTFTLDVAAGRHEVRLRAPGYQSQTRQVLVDEAGITILNVELSKP